MLLSIFGVGLGALLGPVVFERSLWTAPLMAVSEVFAPIVAVVPGWSELAVVGWGDGVESSSGRRRLHGIVWATVGGALPLVVLAGWLRRRQAWWTRVLRSESAVFAGVQGGRAPRESDAQAAARAYLASMGHPVGADEAVLLDEQTTASGPLPSAPGRRDGASAGQSVGSKIRKARPA